VSASQQVLQQAVQAAVANPRLLRAIERVAARTYGGAWSATATAKAEASA
jgi:hypothetical protein